MATEKETDEARMFLRIVQQVIFSDNDRAAVICGAAMLDVQLEAILRRYLIPAKSKGEDEKLFGSNAPLSTFSGKTAMAYRLGLIPPLVADMLDRVRKIRNDFAHDVVVMSLNDAENYRTHISALSRIHRGAESAMLTTLSLEVTPANRLRAIIFAIAQAPFATANSIQTVNPLRDKASVSGLVSPPQGNPTEPPKKSEPTTTTTEQPGS